MKHDLLNCSVYKHKETILSNLLSKSKDFDSLPLLCSSLLAQESFFQWHIILFSRGVRGTISRDLGKNHNLTASSCSFANAKKRRWRQIQNDHQNTNSKINTNTAAKQLFIADLFPENTRPWTSLPEQSDRAATEVSSCKIAFVKSFPGNFSPFPFSYKLSIVRSDERQHYSNLAMKWRWSPANLHHTSILSSFFYHQPQCFWQACQNACQHNPDLTLWSKWQGASESETCSRASSL